MVEIAKVLGHRRCKWSRGTRTCLMATSWRREKSWPRGWGWPPQKIPSDPAVRAELIERFQSYTSAEPAFVGGGFYWHFRQTMSPRNKPDFELLRRAAAR